MRVCPAKTLNSRWANSKVGGQSKKSALSRLSLACPPSSENVPAPLTDIVCFIYWREKYVSHSIHHLLVHIRTGHISSSRDLSQKVDAQKNDGGGVSEG